MLPPLPPAQGYEVWRFQVNTQILAATARPQAVAAWLAEVDSPHCAFGDLAARADPGFATLDCRVFSALLAALTSSKASAAEQEPTPRARARAAPWDAGGSCFA